MVYLINQKRKDDGWTQQYFIYKVLSYIILNNFRSAKDLTHKKSFYLTTSSEELRFFTTLANRFSRKLKCGALSNKAHMQRTATV